jgi:hypothetical protein
MLRAIFVANQPGLLLVKKQRGSPEIGQCMAAQVVLRLVVILFGRFVMQEVN